MDNRTREQKNAEIFRNYPDCNLIAETSDGKVFIDLDKALSHAATLKEKEVTRHKRPPSDAVKELDKVVASTNQGGDDLASAKEAYKELTGKTAHHSWDFARIEEKQQEFILELLKEHKELSGEDAPEGLSGLALKEAIEALREPK